MADLFENLKVGDKVIILFRNTRRVEKVDKVNKVTFRVNTTNYRKSNGWNASSDTWDASLARPWTEEADQELKQERAQRALYNSVLVLLEKVSKSARKAPVEKLEGLKADLIRFLEGQT